MRKSNEVKRKAHNRKANDERIALKRAKGMTMAQIAKEEGITAPTVFNALQRISPELREALRLNGYGLTTAVKKMVEMTDAVKTEFFASNGIVLDSRNVEDNTTRLAARREMLRVHGVGNEMTVEHTGTVEHVLSAKERQEASDSLKRIAQFSGRVIDVEEEE